MKALLAASIVTIGIASGSWAGAGYGYGAEETTYGQEPEYGHGISYGYGYGGNPARLSENARLTGYMSLYEWRVLGRDEARLTGVSIVGYYQDFQYLPSGQYETRGLGRDEARQRDVAFALGTVAEDGTGGPAPMERMSCDESFLNRAEGRAEAHDIDLEDGSHSGPMPQSIIWQC